MRFYSLKYYFPQKNVAGVLKQTKKIVEVGGVEILGCLAAHHAPPGGHAGSENDTLLPWTMTHDQRKFRNDPPPVQKLSSGKIQINKSKIF